MFALAVNQSYVFTGTYDIGIWRRPLSDFGISAVAQSPPVSNAIRTYPNPFSQSTTISFTPDTSGYAEVSIVNLLGVEVARLFAGELGAGEEHTFTWNATGVATGDGYATGMYECLVRMNGRVEKLPVMMVR